MVDNGRDVTLRVPGYRREHVALVYDPELWNKTLEVREADREVTFDACRNKDENPYGKERAQFNGAILVARARCTRFDVLNAKGERIARPRISFGAGRCSR